MPDYLREVNNRKSQMDASKKRLARSARDAIAAIRDLDKALGAAEDDTRSFADLRHKMQGALKLRKSGAHLKYQTRIDTLMPKIGQTLRTLASARKVATKALEDLEKVLGSLSPA